MRKSLLKSLVGVAVVGAAMAMGGISVFAATTIYNISDVTAISAQAYTGSALTGTTSDVVIFKDNDHTITALGATQPVALVDYSGTSYAQSEVAEGDLSGTTLNKALFTTGGNTKNYISISNVAAGSKIGLYYTGVDSKGTPGKEFDIKVADQALGTATKSSTKSTYKTVEITDGGTVYIANAGSRTAVFAIEISDAEAQTVDVNLSVKDALTDSGINAFSVYESESGSQVRAKSGTTYSLTTGVSYVVKADGYTDSEEFTIAATTAEKAIALVPETAKEYKLTASDISAIATAEKDLIASTTLGTDSAFYADYGVGTRNTTTIQVSETSNISFTLTTAGILELNNVRGASSSETRDLTILDDKGSDYAPANTKGINSKSSEAVSVKLQPGTYYIGGAANSGTGSSVRFTDVSVTGTLEAIPVTAKITKAADSSVAAVVQYNAKCYVVAVVSKADANNAKNSNVVLTYNKNSDTVESNTVYSKVTFDQDYDATAFLNGAASTDYVFAAEITDVATDKVSAAIEALKQIKVSVE